MALLWSDDFGRANGALGTTATGGKTWLAGIGSFSIVSGRAQVATTAVPPAGGGAEATTIVASAADGKLKTRLYGGTSGLGLSIRVGADGYNGLYWSANGTLFTRNATGAYATHATGLPTVASGDVIEFEAKGTTGTARNLTTATTWSGAIPASTETHWGLTGSATTHEFDDIIFDAAFPTSGLLLNLRGGSLSGGDGGAISAWGGYAVTGGTLAAASTPNGKNALRLSGTAGNRVALGNLLSGATAGEIMVVLKTQDTANKGWWYFGTGSINHYPYGGLIYESFGNTERPGFTPNATLTDWHVYNVSTGPSSTTNRLMTARQGTATTTALTSIGTHNVAATNGAASFPADVFFGDSTGGWVWNGTVAAIVIYNRVLTDAERSAAYADLKSDLLVKTYAQEVIADAPASYWRFEEEGGTVAGDASGFARNATFNSVPTWRRMALAGGGYSVGVSTHLATSPGSGLPNPVTITAEAWVASTTDSTIIARDSQGNTANPGRHWSLAFSNGGIYWLTFGGGGAYHEMIVPPPTGVDYSDGVARHIVGTWDGATKRVYVNGVEVANVAYSNTAPWDSTQGITIAGPAITADRISGTLDEVAWYPTTLSAARIKAHYDTRLTESIVPVTSPKHTRLYMQAYVHTRPPDVRTRYDATQIYVHTRPVDVRTRYDAAQVLSHTRPPDVRKKVDSLQGYSNILPKVRPTKKDYDNAIKHDNPRGHWPFEDPLAASSGIDNFTTVASLDSYALKRGTWTVSAEGQAAPTTAGDSQILRDLAGNNGTVSVQHPVGLGGGGLVFRNINLDNGWLLWLASNDNLYLYSRSGGTFTQQAHYGVPAGRRDLKVELDDRTIRTYAGGVLMGTITSAHCETGTYFGIRSDAAANRFDDFNFNVTGAPANFRDVLNGGLLRRNGGVKAHLTGGVGAMEGSKQIGSFAADRFLDWPLQPAISGTFTVECMVHFDVNRKSSVGIWGSRGPTECGTTLRWDGTNIIVDIGNGSTWLANVNVPSTIQAGYWYHLALAVKTTGWELFQDGRRIGSGTYNGTPLLTSANHLLRIGRMGTLHDGFFLGDGARVDEFAIYDKAIAGSRFEVRNDPVLAEAETRAWSYVGWGIPI